ncbi:lysophosphatidylserine lipase ABHD12-like [Ornithodoros turicata]|uniref:lysophosphatidylserine lipase ABHD12-like n=1 Tax=Ornithodoros turicata TaxID=34597 RepID=UPI00313A4B19
MLRKRALTQATEILKHNDAVLPCRSYVSYLFPSKRSSRRLLHLLGGVLFVVYGLFPTAFYFSGWFRRFMIFGHYINWPMIASFTNTEYYGLPVTRPFFVASTDHVLLGTWHVMPKSQWSRCSSGINPNTEFDDDRPVIIYYHGHAETRATDYRVQLYKTLSQSEVDAHVITFDYRGFGDSTNVMPSKKGVIEDSLAVYNWVKERVPRSRIIVWGHSLGTGVAVQLGEIFAAQHDNPAAIVLEAPFNSLKEAALKWPLGLPFRYIPGAEKLVERLADDGTYFESEQKVGRITAPTLVMHSKDDPLVPYELGRKLFERLKMDRRSDVPPAEFYDVDSSVGPGHRRIYKDPNFPNMVSKFIGKWTQ